MHASDRAYERQRMRRKVFVIFKCQSKSRPENSRIENKETSTQIQKLFFYLLAANKWLRMNFNALTDSAQARFQSITRRTNWKNSPRRYQQSEQIAWWNKNV